MEYEYKIGTTEGGMQLLTALGISSNPRPTYKPYSVSFQDGNGKTVGEGFPVASWHWDVMRPGESDLLEAFVNGNLSAEVYIRTRLNRLSTDAYTWATFKAIMHWPTGDEDIQSRRAIGLTIEFTHMELIPDP